MSSAYAVLQPGLSLCTSLCVANRTASNVLIVRKACDLQSDKEAHKASEEAHEGATKGHLSQAQGHAKDAAKQTVGAGAAKKDQAKAGHKV